MLQFRTAKQIQEYLEDEYNLWVSQDFIRGWCRQGDRLLTEPWYLEDLLEMGHAGDEVFDEQFEEE